MSTAKYDFGQGRAAGIAWGVVLACAIGCVVVPVAAADPIPIGTIEDLQKIGNEAGFPLNGDYVLTNDIDASATENWNDGAGFDPIGEFGNPPIYFIGSFDGQGFVISGLHINRRSESSVGLFSGVGSGGVVKDVGLEGGSVTGFDRVGSLVGLNSSGTVTQCYATLPVNGRDSVGGLIGLSSGTVTRSYATGVVTGWAEEGEVGSFHVGGLVGQITAGTVSQSYATGAVSSDVHVGGLVGTNRGTVMQSYSTGAVSGSGEIGGLVGLALNAIVSNSYAAGPVSGNYDIGGLVGRNIGSTVTASFWDEDTSGRTDSDGGTGLSTSEMKQQASFDPPWDFDDIWDIDEGRTYPFLPGTPQSPQPGFILIHDIAELQKIGNDPGFPLDGHYAVTNDIDASDTANWNDGAGFAPIGDEPTPFTGSIDGQGFVISGLHINRPGEDRVGLFGFVDTGGEVMNLGLDGGSVTGKEIVGGLVGRNFGAVSQCYATGAVSGAGAVGGLVGVMASGTVTQSYATGTVSGGVLVGGLVGEQFSGAVTQSYATGAVSGNVLVGGLVGRTYFGGAVTDCYATGSVSGGSIVGGLVGTVESNGTVTNSYAAGPVSGTGSDLGGLAGFSTGTVSESYWDTDTSGILVSAGGFGLSTIQMRQQFRFDPWDFDEVWDMIEGLSYPFLRDNPQSPPPGFIAIHDIEELQKIGNDPGYPLFAIYYLVNDIDASDTVTWNDGAGFDPIGSDANPFIGSFDGQGFVISGLHINRPGKDDVGLFGFVFGGAELMNVGLDGGSISGNDYVGGLVGRMTASSVTHSYATGAVSGNSTVGGLAGFINNSTVTQCYTTGAVSGDFSVGGLAGFVSLTAEVAQCYATGAVSGNVEIGGLVGDNRGAVTQCYAAGPVSGNQNIRGLVANNSGTVTHSFWDALATGQATSDGGTMSTTLQMVQQATFAQPPASWDFDDIWAINEGSSYPYLLENPQDPPPSPVIIIITLAEDLQKIGVDPDFPLDGSYVLAGDIDASATETWNEGLGFDPIGEWDIDDPSVAFTGILDGQGFTISGLYINRPDEDIVGLFSVIGLGGEVRNLGLEGGSVTGRHDVGGLAGRIVGGVVTNSYATSAVTGGFDVGGLAGRISNGGALSNSYATGAVTGTTRVGGLVGWTVSGSVTNSYAMGEITGNSSVGGLVGSNSGAVSSSYAVGVVAGNTFVGGLVGISSNGSTMDAGFWDTETSGQTNSAGGTGLPTAQMQQASTFTDAGWDFEEIWFLEIEGFFYPLLQAVPLLDPAPVIRLNGDAVITISCLDTYQELGALAQDLDLEPVGQRHHAGPGAVLLPEGGTLRSVQFRQQCPFLELPGCQATGTRDEVDHRQAQYAQDQGAGHRISALPQCPLDCLPAGLVHAFRVQVLLQCAAHLVAQVVPAGGRQAGPLQRGHGIHRHAAPLEMHQGEPALHLGVAALGADPGVAGGQFVVDRVPADALDVQPCQEERGDLIPVVERQEEQAACFRHPLRVTPAQRIRDQHGGQRDAARRMAGIDGATEPKLRLRTIPLDALAGEVHPAELDRHVVCARLGGGLVPSRRLARVAGHAVAFLVHPAEIAHGRRRALSSRSLEGCSRAGPVRRIQLHQGVRAGLRIGARWCRPRVHDFGNGNGIAGRPGCASCKTQGQGDEEYRQEVRGGSAHWSRWQWCPGPESNRQGLAAGGF